MKNQIFCVENAKAAKAAGYGYLNAIHYMAPADAAGVGNLCPFLSEGCKDACLGMYAGHAAIIPTGKRTNPVRQSRRAKARRFMLDRKAYLRDVVHALELVERKAQRDGLKLCVRMNGSTDISWEGIAVERGGNAYRNIFAAFPHVQFVDYTKNPNRLKALQLPDNYHLTFSRSETNEDMAANLLHAGWNVAIVFAENNKWKGGYWNGYPVVDGDTHDLRHLDPRGGALGGYVIGLSPKGAKAKRDTSGFVVRS